MAAVSEESREQQPREALSEAPAPRAGPDGAAAKAAAAAAGAPPPAHARAPHARALPCPSSRAEPEGGAAAERAGAVAGAVAGAEGEGEGGAEAPAQGRLPDGSLARALLALLRQRRDGAEVSELARRAGSREEDVERVADVLQAAGAVRPCAGRRLELGPRFMGGERKLAGGKRELAGELLFERIGHVQARKRLRFLEAGARTLELGLKRRGTCQVHAEDVEAALGREGERASASEQVLVLRGPPGAELHVHKKKEEGRFQLALKSPAAAALQSFLLREGALLDLFQARAA